MNHARNSVETLTDSIREPGYEAESLEELVAELTQAGVRTYHTCAALNDDEWYLVILICLSYNRLCGFSNRQLAALTTSSWKSSAWRTISASKDI